MDKQEDKMRGITMKVTIIIKHKKCGFEERIKTRYTVAEWENMGARTNDEILNNYMPVGGLMDYEVYAVAEDKHIVEANKKVESADKSAFCGDAQKGGE